MKRENQSAGESKLVGNALLRRASLPDGIHGMEWMNDNNIRKGKKER